MLGAVQRKCAGAPITPVAEILDGALLRFCGSAVEVRLGDFNAIL